MRCRMPKCRGVATKTWSMVEVCSTCYNAIDSETKAYYSRKILLDDRVLNRQIRAIKGVTRK